MSLQDSVPTLGIREVPSHAPSQRQGGTCDPFAFALPAEWKGSGCRRKERAGGGRGKWPRLACLHWLEKGAKAGRSFSWQRRSASLLAVEWQALQVPDPGRIP